MHRTQSVRARLGAAAFACLAGVAALAVVPAIAAAQVTPPASGAAAKPLDFDIGLPFVAGEQVYVTSGYSPSGGSSLHDGTNRTSSSNDYHALDLVLPAHPNGGRGRPVVAAASGMVVRAGWATSGWASYGQRVIIVHDYAGDGHTYTSLYAHLDSIDVTEGQTVAKGQQLGTLGGSSNGSLTGLGFHLHFSIHRDSTVGGSGTGGSYGGNAVVPETIDGYGNLTKGQTLISRNDGAGAMPCQLIGTSETILDDQGPCFRRYGNASYWHDEASGYMDHSVWTYTIDGASPDNSVRWLLELEQAGNYELWAYVPAGFGKSRQARYSVRHAGSSDDAVRDQSASQGGWLSLGVFTFAAGPDQYVELGDNSGEPYTDTNGTTIAFDALRIRPSVAPGEPDAGATNGGADAGPGGEGPDAGTGGNGGGGIDEPGAPSGCGCQASSGGPGDAAGWLLLLLCAALVSRRRASLPS